ncbi:MAG: hypothetical protein A3G34_00510 [Candidatus Lindowbacteria bacterium RIFCSPLOWO2_12_FULL_62_27]|nr:MAG: hypothetical protein A3G34_00510 [Candidatus Lindowbacteria bacterium RIFCSPLOWO2_12_FULL_62_27]OGH58203.1 MAG: hypothetical protein A3I06_01045 [Candidatus Lindowbacteria bacterium RIFCSPLOWO2_02_FULL_62_12]
MIEDPEVLSTFLDEADERIQSVTDHLLAVEKSGELSKDRAEHLQRTLHNLKGAGRMIGLTHFQNLVHTMEGLVKAAGTGLDPAELVQLLLEGADEIRIVCGSMRAASRPLDPPELDTVNDKLALFLPAEQPPEPVEASEPPHLHTGAPLPIDHHYDPAEAGIMLDDFLAEADEMLETLQNACLALEKSPSLGEINNVFRVAHTLKGSSGIINLKAMNELTHSLEELLDGARKGEREITREWVDLLLAALDELSVILKKLKTKREFDHDIGPMIGRIEALKEGRPINAARADTPGASQPAAHESDPPKPAASEGAAQSIRVDIVKLDKVINLVGELAIAKIRFDQRIHEAESLKDELARVARAVRGEFDAAKVRSDIELLDATFLETLEDQRRASEDLQRISGELQEAVMRTRMVPVAQVLNKFPRMARDISKAQNKTVNLSISGEETEMDKTVVERIGDPLMHLVRNAIDHGIESPAERRRAGKPEAGSVSIRACYQGDQVVIEVSDDGGGIRRQKVLAAAVEKGLLTREEAEVMTPAAALDLIFKPGLSTADKVTDISGRGVGMDVVRDSIAKLKGVVSVHSEEGKGSTFTVKLPLTLAIIQVLMVKAGGRRLAMPLAAVQESLLVESKDIHSIGPRETFNLRGEAMSLVRLADMLGDAGHAWSGGSSVRHIVVATSGREKVGLEVDAFEGKREVVIKTLGTVLKRVRFAAGTTIMGDGSLVLIADLHEIVRASKEMEAVSMARRIVDKAPMAKDAARDKTVEPPAGAAPPRTFRASLLLVDDSPTVLQLLSPGIESGGIRVFKALDGRQALEILKKEKIDAIATDVAMPQMDGYELCRRVRKMPGKDAMPVILFSAKGEKMDKIRGFDAGADDYFVKPFEPSAIVAKLESMLRLVQSK